MKTEDFDDAIRDKFNTPLPPVSDAEIDAVFRNINNRRLAKTHFHWRRFALFTAVAMLLGGLLFWNIRLSTKQQNLATEVKQLNERLDQEYAIKEEGKSNTGQAEKSPTITPPSSNIETKINSSTPTQVSKNPTTNRTEQSSTSGAYKKEDNSEYSLSSENNLKSNTKTEIVDTKTNADSALTIASEMPKNILKADESEQKPVVNKTTSKIKFNFLTGISADLSMPFTGLNLLEEVQIGKHWSITTGLRHLTFGDEQFGNEEEYNEKAHEEFKERFKAHIADSNEIGEIEIHDQFLQIPLLLNYRFPLKNGFEMLLSTGSDINLYFKKSVQFISKTPSNFETPVALVEKPDFKTVHDIRLGFGVQKHWNQYSIQIVPEAVYLFNTPNVFVKPLNPGIRIGAFYRI